MATKKSLKGGHDCVFVESPPQCLECSICLLTLCDPHVTSCCGNHFCHYCISQVLASTRVCPLCNETGFTTLLHKGVQREVNGLSVYCQWKRLGCDWQGKLGELPGHLEPKDGERSGCGLVLVECGNKCGTLVERRQLADHETEDCPKRPIEVQMSNLTKKLESRLTVVENRLEDVLKEREETRGRLSNVEEQNKKLTEENSGLKRELKAIKRITTHSSDTPPYYYTLYNYNYYKKANIVLFSPPFYSHPGGYKLRLQLYPNGTKHAKNKSLSFFVAIMAGEHDSELEWPFNGTVCVEVFNCDEEKWDHESSFPLTPMGNNRCVKRPVDCVANDGSGTITWLSHDELYKYYMISGYDFVRFRVKEVNLHNV